MRLLLAPDDLGRPGPPVAVGPRAAVVGLGSVVMGDDGAGAAVLAHLTAAWHLPAGVDILDLGTPGPYLAEHLRGYDRLILVDTINCVAPPGTVRTYSGEAVLAAAVAPRLSPHQPNLAEALGQLALEGMAPRSLLVVGVVPELVGAGTELTAAVRSAVPEMVQTILDALREWGLAAFPRTPAVAPDLWWERLAVPSIASD
jgi:hydrogenase maturation protease